MYFICCTCMYAITYFELAVFTFIGFPNISHQNTHTYFMSHVSGKLTALNSTKNWTIIFFRQCNCWQSSNPRTAREPKLGHWSCTTIDCSTLCLNWILSLKKYTLGSRWNNLLDIFDWESVFRNHNPAVLDVKMASVLFMLSIH